MRGWTLLESFTKAFSMCWDGIRWCLRSIGPKIQSKSVPILLYYLDKKVHELLVDRTIKKTCLYDMRWSYVTFGGAVLSGSYINSLLQLTKRSVTCSNNIIMISGVFDPINPPSQ